MKLGSYQNQTDNLPSISNQRYESIFKIYDVEDTDSNYRFYNILNKVTIPDDIDESLLGTISLNVKIPWTILSYRLYKTQFLWWLVFLLNKPKNIFYADSGIEYKYILPQNIGTVLDTIESQLN